MKRPGAYTSVSLLFLAAFSEVVSAADNYVNPATVPPSLRREGLVRSPDQLDAGGNLLVTGNVRGGAYFRGVVPYRAPTDFGATLPSSSLDSFLRDSTSTEDFGGRNPSYSLGIRPYYSPTQTVADTMTGTSIMAGTPTTNISAYTFRSYISGTLPVRRDEILDPSSALSLARLRPLSMTPAEMQKLISSEIANYSPARLTEQQYRPQAEQGEPNSAQQSYKIIEPGQTATGMNELLSPLALKKPDSNLPAAVQRELPDEKKAGMLLDMPEELDLNKQIDVYDSMKQQLDSLQKKLEQAMSGQQTEKARTGETPAEGRTPPAAGSQSWNAAAAGQGGEKPAGEQTQLPSRTDKLAEADLSAARAKGVLGSYGTFASRSEDKFNENMRAGEMFLKQGKFYRAADAYTLASLYKPDDPLAYAGKSHALFASGEYMSSALFLARCLQIFPEYARFKIDLVSMIGNRDMLESRVVDAEEWLKRSGSPELQFLLAYIYYQMDRLQPAKEAVNAVFEKMPDAPAVLALKKVIEDSTPAADNVGGSQRITGEAKPAPGQPKEEKQ